MLTFPKAFFAMPLFDWSSSTGGGIVTQHFWIYWAVTVPLTLAVLLTWTIWDWFRSRRQGKEDLAVQQTEFFGHKEWQGNGDAWTRRLLPG